jgi:serine/threonine-protein kinase
MVPGMVIDDTYEIVRHLCDGGMGSVWEASDRGTGRTVAIKFPHADLTANPAEMSSFLLEAEAARLVGGSPNVVELIDVANDAGLGLFMVMERLEGEDLRDHLNREGTLDPSSAVEIVRQVCAGLAELHRRGVCHRDLKPENIFLSRSETGGLLVKILDFGTAELQGARGRRTRHGAARAVCSGTPQYMAPERLMHDGRCDHRVDIYALGAILYELLTGRPPFTGASLVELVGNIMSGGLAPPRVLCPEISVALEAVVMRALAFDADARFATADDLANALDACEWSWPCTDAVVNLVAARARCGDRAERPAGNALAAPAPASGGSRSIRAPASAWALTRRLPAAVWLGLAAAVTLACSVAWAF